jgi:hypothetical protein
VGHDDDDDDDPDVADLNNPDVETLAEPPLLGRQPRPSDLGYGDEAQGFGRATSPKLYASAAQFPTAVQFRVWRWENGIPVGLGAIDSEATEEDFVRAFFAAMPEPGKGNFQFRMRPIDMRGAELGKEFTLNISEHHATLRQLRELKKREEEERMSAGGGWGRGPHGDIIVNGGGADQVGASYAEEMGRMFEQAVESAEEQNRVLRDSLESERDRLRVEEKTRAEERISLAQRSADTVEKMMERLMMSDRTRSEEQMKGQKEHSGFMMNTLTGVFGQQQEAARQQAVQMREQDSLRMQQDREFFDRQRQETEMRRTREREEAEEKRRAEKDEMEAKRRGEKEEWEARRNQERDEAERRRRSDGEEWERKRQEERERLSVEQRRWEESRKMEAEQIRAEAQRRDEQIRTESQRRESDLERRREMEKEEMKVRSDRERMELEQRQTQLREEREKLRIDADERRVREKEEFERKMATEREDRDRRERADRERWEREHSDAEKRREDERREWERREAQRRDEMLRETERRREEMQLQMKQMDMTATRDREHAERMAEMARLERDAQREAGLQREKTERDGRESAERDRTRQFELQKFEMEQAKERDREHAERMLQMTKLERSGGLSGITEMLGMETPEVLAKIFGGGGGSSEDGSWAEAIPKVLGALAEVGAKAFSSQKPPEGGGGARRQQAPQAQQPQQKLIPIQTPEGIKMIPADALARLQAARSTPGIPVMAPQNFESDLPTAPFLPPQQEEEEEEGAPEPERQEARRPAKEVTPTPSDEEEIITPEFRAAAKINPIKRAKEAGLKFSDQRAARRAIRDLLPRLEVAKPEEWVGIVAETLAKEPVVYEYLKAVTIYVALAESKVAPGIVEKVVREMRATGLIPAEVPYTEADYEKLKAATGKEAAESEGKPVDTPKTTPAPLTDAEKDMKF